MTLAWVTRNEAFDEGGVRGNTRSITKHVIFAAISVTLFEDPGCYPAKNAFHGYLSPMVVVHLNGL